MPFESNIITIEYPITLDEFASPELKLIEEDIDEIRRFATGSGEINVNGGSF